MPTKSYKSKKSANAPDMPPPTAIRGNAGAQAEAPTMAPEEIVTYARAGGAGAPVMTPPAEAVTEEIADTGIAAWHNGKKVTAMWANSSVRNSYAAVEGLGWKRLSNANDSSWVALTMLASHAEQVNANCNVRIESDNEIHEIYVF